MTFDAIFGGEFHVAVGVRTASGRVTIHVILHVVLHDEFPATLNSKVYYVQKSQLLPHIDFTGIFPRMVSRAPGKEHAMVSLIVCADFRC